MHRDVSTQDCSGQRRVWAFEFELLSSSLSLSFILLERSMQCYFFNLQGYLWTLIYLWLGLGQPHPYQQSKPIYSFEPDTEHQFWALKHLRVSDSYLRLPHEAILIDLCTRGKLIPMRKQGLGHRYLISKPCRGHVTYYPLFELKFHNSRLYNFLAARSARMTRLTH